MPVHSRILSILEQGLVLDVTMDDLGFTAYVVVSAPDLDLIPRLVPEDDYRQYGNLHVTAIDTADDAQARITDIAFNMGPGDAAVLMCQDTAAYHAALAELGQPGTPAGGARQPS